MRPIANWNCCCDAWRAFREQRKQNEQLWVQSAAAQHVATEYT